MESKHINPVAKMRELRSRRPQTSFEQILAICQPSSRATIVELACIDLIDRIRSGDGVQVEQYLKAAPELGADTEELLDLIDAEICTRREKGDVPVAEEYVKRFPDLATEVGRLFVLDNIESQLESDAIPTREKTPEISGYRLTRRICGDSISDTYRAQSSDRQSCFVRVFAPGSRENRHLGDQLRLAIAPTRHWHPNVLAVYQLDAIDDRLFCVTEVVDGLPLSVLVAKRLAPKKVSNWLHAIVMAIAFAQSEGRSLGQICATHVLIDHKDQPRIIGCGLPIDETQTVAREQSDLANVGALMFQMLTGQLYATQVTSDEFIKSSSDRTFETTPVDPALESICLKCLGHAQPGYQTLTALANDLSLFTNGRYGPVSHKSSIRLSNLLR